MREKLIELLCKAHNAVTDKSLENDSEFGMSYDEQIETEADSLIAHGVTIPVHCKDCKHWADGVAGCTEHIKCCKIGFYMVGENGYCVYGERKENGTWKTGNRSG